MSLYPIDGNDHAGIWSDFCLLVDVAVIAKEEEESMMKRVFDLIPRKKRSSFSKKRKRYDRQNPNSHTAESEKTKKKDPSNPSSDTAESAKKDPSNPNSDTAESAKKDPSNPSSDTAESAKKDPSNPNYNSSSSSLKRKRCTAVKEKNKNKGRFKKANLYPRRTITETPEWVSSVIRRMNNGDADNPTLIFEKTLTSSDVNKSQSRLLIPCQQLLQNDFLTHEESLAIRSGGVETHLFNQRSEKWDLRLKIWAMGKDTYALKKGWNDVVKSNNLKAEDNICLWSFRCEGVLSFVLETH